jgi:DNA-directed RNA polymerase specialized sigma24 family protein
MVSAATAAVFVVSFVMAWSPSRTVFLLKRMDGLSYQEIAERLCISLRTVNRNMAKASDYLCRHLDRRG